MLGFSKRAQNIMFRLKRCLQLHCIHFLHIFFEFIEVGEGRVSSSLVRATDRRANCAAVYSIRNAPSEMQLLLNGRGWTEDAGCRMADSECWLVDAGCPDCGSICRMMCLIPPPVLRIRHSNCLAYAHIHTSMADTPLSDGAVVQFSGAQLISAAIVHDKQMALQTFSHVAQPAVVPPLTPSHLPLRVSSLAQLHPGITYHGNRLDFVVNKMFSHEVFQMKIHCDALLNKLELQRA